MEGHQRPVLQRILPTLDSSFLLKHYPDPTVRGDKVPNYHYHPELELVFVNGGNGRRHVGSHVSYFDDGELILIGSNLPHWGFTDRNTGNRAETVVQFSPNFPTPDFRALSEFSQINNLLERAKNGISFTGRTKEVEGRRLERMVELDPLGRLLLLLDVLRELSESEEYESLNADGVHIEIATHGYERFNNVQQFISDNFRRDLAVAEAASVAAMTVPAFCRYFKKVTGKTFVTYLTNFRIVYACKLLSDEHSTIAEVAFDCGFNSLSQFNRSFKKVTERTPTEYRLDLRKTVGGNLPSG
ncbi:AraC family transcriptional regulator [Neolewinella antarctica]|uniref:AraC-like DNA-binding protein n=1 Tax=Neolewinella antarctica TaxID=442734 RepID=A0ABX0X5S3_9BACT|nr:AraC family transcriptional regulator [Neolewinella antarctica]NJC24556.1 AraC-like DNA-binding protein [Neolewinella antarctica]